MQLLYGIFIFAYRFQKRWARVDILEVVSIHTEIVEESWIDEIALNGWIILVEGSWCMSPKWILLDAFLVLILRLLLRVEIRIRFEQTLGWALVSESRALCDRTWTLVLCPLNRCFLLLSSNTLAWWWLLCLRRKSRFERLSRWHFWKVRVRSLFLPFLRFWALRQRAISQISMLDTMNWLDFCAWQLSDSQLLHIFDLQLYFLGRGVTFTTWLLIFLVFGRLNSRDLLCDVEDVLGLYFLSFRVYCVFRWSWFSQKLLNFFNHDIRAEFQWRLSQACFVAWGDDSFTRGDRLIEKEEQHQTLDRKNSLLCKVKKIWWLGLCWFGSFAFERNSYHYLRHLSVEVLH